MTGYLSEVTLRVRGAKAVRGWPRVEGHVVGPAWLWEGRPAPERLPIVGAHALLEAWVAARERRDYPEADRVRGVPLADAWEARTA